MIPWSRSSALAGLVLAGLALAGCQGTVQEAFGLRKRAPDEFQVVRGRPLVVPPDRNLRPPQPGASGPGQVDAARSARATLVGQSAEAAPSTGDAAAGRGEAALLRAARGEADPDIRRRLAEDDSQLAFVDESTFLFILDWQRRAAQAPASRGEALDPAAEARRLQGSGRVQTTRRTAETGG